MDTFQDCYDEVAARLQVADNSTLFTAARIKTVFLQQYRWATDLFIWDDLVQGKDSQTVAGHDYYDYPDGLRTNGLTRVSVNGEDNEYDKKTFASFIDFRANHPDETETLIFAPYGRYFFLFPTPTAALSLTVWGAISAPMPSNDNQNTLFTDGGMSVGNEALVQQTLSVLKGEALPNASAVQILATLAATQQSNKQDEQVIENPQFDVPDFFAPGGSPVGNFSVRNR